MKTFDAEWRARFERFGRTHAEEHEVSGWSPEGLARRVRLFGQLMAELPLPKRARILELGCGAGTYVRYLAGLGHLVIGVDYAWSSLRRAVASDPDRKGSYVAADGYALPFAPASFDLVVCIGVLQALSRPEQLLDEVTQILRERGILVLEALNAFEFQAIGRRVLETLGRRPRRVRCYAPSQVQEWLEQRQIRPVRHLGVYLPPRRFPTMGRLFDRRAVVRFLEEIPGGCLVGPHAFWLVGQKSS